MPEPPSSASSPIGWRVLIDINTHTDVERFFQEAGAMVESARTALRDTASDSEIDDYAQRNGCIIVSHDRRFMQLIQRRLYQRDIAVSTGYGRILLSGNERSQATRLKEVLPILAAYHHWAVDTNHRFIVTIADNWIRFDDKPIARPV